MWSTLLFEIVLTWLGFSFVSLPLLALVESYPKNFPDCSKKA